MAGRTGAGVCGVRPRKMLPFSFGVHATVYQIEVFVILGKKRKGKAYTYDQNARCFVGP